MIGAKDEKEIEDIMAKINDDREEGSSGEENNEEGIDIDLEDDHHHGDEEEKKEEKSKTSKGKGKKANASDEGNSDGSPWWVIYT